MYVYRCSDRCLNRRFQQRKFAQLSVREVGGKGFGLFTDQGTKSMFCDTCMYVCMYLFIYGSIFI